MPPLRYKTRIRVFQLMKFEFSTKISSLTTGGNAKMCVSVNNRNAANILI